MNATRKIALLLTIVFLLPALFFSGYELSSLSKDGAMIQEVYNKQLEAILFSVNQYSDDAINRWMSQIQSGMATETPPGLIPPPVAKMLELNSSLHAVFVVDSIERQPQPVVYSLNDSTLDVVRSALSEQNWKEKAKVDQLVSYQRSGFQKVEGLDGPTVTGNRQAQWIVFILENSRQQPRFAGALIDPELFIEDLIGPRLQGIARDQFVLSVVRKSNKVIVYNSSPTDSIGTGAEALTKDLWLLPDYALGIRSKGASIQHVIEERTLTNMILLLAVDVVLILSVVLVYRNIKKEVQLAENKSDFVSNVSHEIRTPLALISMFAETLVLSRVISEEKKKEYYTIIHKEAHRLSGIVNNILNFSQNEVNKKTYHPTRLHPDTEIRDILNTYEFHLTNKGFTYMFQGSPELYIRADRGAFIEVMINLIDNAMKYSPGQKRVVISCRREGEAGLVIVQDFGVGISHAEQKHIFDKFYRVSSGNLAKTRGTGLGLSLVKQLMEAQAGTVRVTSEPGQGSTFALTFPLDPST